MAKTAVKSTGKETVKKMLHRVSRIEGQVRGIHKMIEEDKDCRDIVTQISAAQAALSGLGAEILKNELICRQRERKRVDERYLRSLFKF